MHALQQLNLNILTLCLSVGLIVSNKRHFRNPLIKRRKSVNIIQCYNGGKHLKAKADVRKRIVKRPKKDR